MTHICVMSSHKPLYEGVNTKLYSPGSYGHYRVYRVDHVQCIVIQSCNVALGMFFYYICTSINVRTAYAHYMSLYMNKYNFETSRWNISSSSVRTSTCNALEEMETKLEVRQQQSLLSITPAHSQIQYQGYMYVRE